MKELKDEGYISVQDAAKLAKRPTPTVHRWIQRGWLTKIVRNTHRVFVDRSEVRALAKRMNGGV